MATDTFTQEKLPEEKTLPPIASGTALAIDSKHKRINALINRGIAFVKFDQYQEAISAFNAVLAIDPKSIDVLNKRALKMYELGRFEVVLSISTAILTNNPSNARAYSIYIEAQEALEKAAVAVKYVGGNEKEENKTEKTEEKSAHPSPSFPFGILGSHNYLIARTDNKKFLLDCNEGYRLFLSGNFRQASHQYKLALEIEPTAIWAHYNRGLGLTALRRYTEAEKCYRIALSLATSSNTSKADL